MFLQITPISLLKNKISTLKSALIPNLFFPNFPSQKWGKEYVIKFLSWKSIILPYFLLSVSYFIAKKVDSSQVWWRKRSSASFPGTFISVAPPRSNGVAWGSGDENCALRCLLPARLGMIQEICSMSKPLSNGQHTTQLIIFAHCHPAGRKQQHVEWKLSHLFCYYKDSSWIHFHKYLFNLISCWPILLGYFGLYLTLHLILPLE